MRLMPDELFQSNISDRKSLPYGEFDQAQLVALARCLVTRPQIHPCGS